MLGLLKNNYGMIEVFRKRSVLAKGPVPGEIAHPHRVFVVKTTCAAFTLREPRQKIAHCPLPAAPMFFDSKNSLHKTRFSLFSLLQFHDGRVHDFLSDAVKHPFDLGLLF